MSRCLDLMRGRGMTFTTRQQADLVTPATLAFEHGDEVEQAQVAKSWRELAEEFWHRTAADDEKRKLKAPRLHRTIPSE